MSGSGAIGAKRMGKGTKVLERKLAKWLCLSHIAQELNVKPKPDSAGKKPKLPELWLGP
jgi:hypothetical protein